MSRHLALGIEEPEETAHGDHGRGQREGRDQRDEDAYRGGDCPGFGNN